MKAICVTRLPCHNQGLLFTGIKVGHGFMREKLSNIVKEIS